ATNEDRPESGPAYEEPRPDAAGQPKPDDVRLQEFRRRRQFHELIDQAAHNPTLSDMIATTTAFDFQQKSRALLHGAFPEPHPPPAEPRETLDALLPREGPGAEALMREHSAN